MGRFCLKFVIIYKELMPLCENKGIFMVIGVYYCVWHNSSGNSRG